MELRRTTWKEFDYKDSEKNAVVKGDV